MIQSENIDKLNRNIIELLAQDARISNRSIASQLDVTEGTVRARIKWLEQNNFIRITAITNMSYMEKPQLAFIGIHAEQSLLKQTAAQIAEMDEINAVIILLGRYDILAIGLFSGLEQLRRTGSDKILAMDGVRHIETTIVTDIKKYNNHLAKIVPLQSKYKLSFK